MKGNGKDPTMPTPPPSIGAGTDDGDGDGDGGDEEGDEEDEKMVKALLARISSYAADGTPAPAPTPAPVPMAAPAESDGTVVLDARDFVKTIQANIAASRRSTEAKVGDVATLQVTMLQNQGAMAKSLAALRKDNDELRSTVDDLLAKSQGRRGYMNIYEPPVQGTGAKSMDQGDYLREGQALIAKSIIAAEQGKVGVAVPGLLDLAIRRQVPLNEAGITPMDLHVIRSIKADA